MIGSIGRFGLPSSKLWATSILAGFIFEALHSPLDNEIRAEGSLVPRHTQPWRLRQRTRFAVDRSHLHLPRGSFRAAVTKLTAGSGAT